MEHNSSLGTITGLIRIDTTEAPFIGDPNMLTVVGNTVVLTPDTGTTTAITTTNSNTVNKNSGVFETTSTAVNIKSTASGTNSPIPINLYTGDLLRASVDTTGNVVINTTAVSTTATSGFLWIPSCSGIPTGSPTAPYTNAAALVVDTANQNLVHRSGSTWVTNTKLTGTNSQYGWNDITSDITVRGTGVNNPTWATFRNGISAFSFSATAMNECWLNFHIKHDYAPGTPIHLHTHWSTTGTNTGVCRFGFEYTIAKGHQQSQFNATSTVYVEQAATGTAYTHMIAETTGITSSEIEPDTLILVRVFRDVANAADTLTDAAFVFTADIHYQCDRLATLNKSPNFYI